MDGDVPILVCSSLAVRIGVAVIRAIDGDWESRIEERGSRQLPSSQYSIEERICAAAVGSTSAVGQFVHTDEIQAVPNVHARRTVVGVAVVAVLIGAVGAVDVGSAVVA